MGDETQQQPQLELDSLLKDIIDPSFDGIDFIHDFSSPESQMPEVDIGFDQFPTSSDFKMTELSDLAVIDSSPNSELNSGSFHTSSESSPILSEQLFQSFQQFQTQTNAQEQFQFPSQPLQQQAQSQPQVPSNPIPSPSPRSTRSKKVPPTELNPLMRGSMSSIPDLTKEYNTANFGVSTSNLFGSLSQGSSATNVFLNNGVDINPVPSLTQTPSLSNLRSTVFSTSVSNLSKNPVNVTNNNSSKIPPSLIPNPHLFPNPPNNLDNDLSPSESEQNLNSFLPPSELPPYYTAKTSPPPDIQREILQLINWNPADHHPDRLVPPKRPKTIGIDKEAQNDRHKVTEKLRRNEMNDLIDRLRKLLPINQDSKMTKMTILNEGVEYLTRIQGLCVQLLLENKRLKMGIFGNLPSSFQFQSNVEHNSKKRKLPSVSSTTLFGIFVCIALCSPLSNLTFEPSKRPSRGILEAANTNISFFMEISNVFWVILLSLLFLFVLFLFFVFSQSFVSPESEAFKKARNETQQGDSKILGGQFTTKISPHYQKALEYLNRAPPDSNFLLIFYLIYQFIRHLMHKLEIGVWTEKSIIQLKGATPEFGKLVSNAAVHLLKNEQPSLFWLYLAASTINLARALDLHDELKLLESACIFRISKNHNSLFRYFARYLDWDLSNHQLSYKLDHDIEHEVENLIGEVTKYVVEGKLDNALELLKKALYLSSLETKEKWQYLSLVKALANLGALLILQRKWKEGVYIFKTCIEISMLHNHLVGRCWGLLGLITCLLHMDKLEKTTTVVEYFEQHFQDELEESPEGLMFATVKASLLLKKELFKEAFKFTPEIIKGLRDNRMQDVLFYSIIFYDVATNVLLDLWEESLNKDMIQDSKSLALYAHEGCAFMHKISHSYSLIEPLAHYCEGQYYFLEKNYAKAKDCWNLASSAASKYKLGEVETLIVSHIQHLPDSTKSGTSTNGNKEKEEEGKPKAKRRGLRQTY